MILELGALAASAIGYIIGGIKSSKGIKQAGDEISVEIWNWIRPIFLKEDKDLVEEIENEPDNNNLQAEIQNKIKRLANKDPEFAQHLEKLIKSTPEGNILFANNLEAENIIIKNTQIGQNKADFNNLKAKNNLNIDNQQE